MAILEVKDVNKAFGGLKALNAVNLSVEEGTVHAIIGPNGAGKSTLLNCFVGRLIPDTGSVIFNGRSLLGIKPHEINQTGVARVFQTPEIFTDLSILENVMIPAFAKVDGSFRINAWKTVGTRGEVRDMAEKVLEEVGLQEKRDIIASSLSRGDKRRLEMAMCLVQDPKLLLLDEPTAGMSRADTNNTVDLLQRVGTHITKIVIEHDMHVVFSLADHISVLAQGTVIAGGKPEDIKGNPKVQEAYLGGRTHECRNGETGRNGSGAVRGRLFLLPGAAELLRRELYRSGRQLRCEAGRDPGIAGPERRRQDVDAAYHRAHGRSATA